MFFYASTFSEPYPIDAEVYQVVLETGEPSLQTISIGQEEYAVLVAPMLGYGERIIGVIEIVNSRVATLARIQADTRNNLFIALILLGLGLGLVWFASRSLVTNPLAHLTAIAQRQIEGDLNARAELNTNDELETLGTTLNTMTSQLQSTLAGLEQRVEERTSNLRLTAQVGQTVSQVSDLDTMLTQAAELILEQFDLYYVQVYLADEQHSLLTIEAGTGAVGKELLEREHSLPISSASINGRAAMEKRAVVIPDTSQSATFLKNPLLPETRGEMAIPLIAVDHVVGVLDMQSSQPNVLTEDVLPAFEALAGQLAVAIENAKLLEEAEQARVELEAQARRQIRTNWDEHLDAIHKPEQIGYSFDQNEVVPLNVMDEENIPDTNNAVSAPISFVGEELGALMVELDNEEKTAQTSELVNIVARQVAQQLENLRLLENAERYRHEVEEATRRQTLEGWEAYLASRKEQGLNYLYNLKEVLPYQGGQYDEDSFAFPLKARDEEVGKLAIKGLSTEDRDSFELANAVAERLGSHIENLRLAEQTRQSLAETAEQTERLARLNALSEAFAQSESLEDIYKVSANLLGEVIPADRFSMTQITKQGDMLEVFALQGEGGAIPTGTQLPIKGTAVGTAFSERRGVIVPDLAEKTYMENELLAKQGLQSTLSVPLIVAGQTVGTLNFGSTKPNNYTSRDQDLAVQAASLMASSIESRQQYAQSQRQAEREAMLNTINQKIQNATSVEAVLQIAARELGHALGAPMTVAQLSIKDQE